MKQQQQCDSTINLEVDSDYASHMEMGYHCQNLKIADRQPAPGPLCSSYFDSHDRWLRAFTKIWTGKIGHLISVLDVASGKP